MTDLKSLFFFGQCHLATATSSVAYLCIDHWGIECWLENQFDWMSLLIVCCINFSSSLAAVRPMATAYRKRIRSLVFLFFVTVNSKFRYGMCYAFCGNYDDVPLFVFRSEHINQLMFASSVFDKCDFGRANHNNTMHNASSQSSHDTEYEMHAFHPNEYHVHVAVDEGIAEYSINNMRNFANRSLCDNYCYCSCVAIVVCVRERARHIQWAPFYWCNHKKKREIEREKIPTQMWLCIAYFIVEEIRRKCHEHAPTRKSAKWFFISFKSNTKNPRDSSRFGSKQYNAYNDWTRMKCEMNSQHFDSHRRQHDAIEWRTWYVWHEGSTMKKK